MDIQGEKGLGDAYNVRKETLSKSGSSASHHGRLGLPILWLTSARESCLFSIWLVIYRIKD
jgi:hypothetical protein